jgi:hypothetical protein
MESKTLNVSIEEIEAALHQLFDTLRKNGVTSLTVGHDLYGTISPEDSFDPSKSTVAKIGFGDLFDDAERVKQILSDNTGIAGMDFFNIAGLLNFLGVRFPSMYDERLIEMDAGSGGQ